MRCRPTSWIFLTTKLWSSAWAKEADNSNTKLARTKPTPFRLPKPVSSTEYANQVVAHGKSHQHQQQREAYALPQRFHALRQGRTLDGLGRQVQHMPSIQHRDGEQVQDS